MYLASDPATKPQKGTGLLPAAMAYLHSPAHNTPSLPDSTGLKTPPPAPVTEPHTCPRMTGKT